MRFLKARRQFRDLLETWSPGCVVFEEVRRHRGVDAAHVYGGLLAILQTVCEEREVPYSGIPVATIKRAATGRGGGKGTGKAEMIAAANERWGLDLDDDNEADALWCALCGVEELAA